jgi:hypothetical protein
MHGLQLLVNRNDLEDTRWQQAPVPAPDELAPGEVLLRIDEFALTANNITYAVAGEMMRYWNFFPAPDGWGRVPVWGFATVVASNHAEVATGERLYGYLPMGSHLLIEAGRVRANQLTDVSAHRVDLPPVYNQFQRVDAASEPAADAAQMLYRPSFMTSFVLDHFLHANGFFGAQSVILTSASSKTALGLALLLARRGDVRVIGLTGRANVGFVEGLGCYDEVVAYEDLATLDAAREVVSVDMAGNGEVLAALHNHFADNLKYSCLVGATHWDHRAGAREMAGPEPELFFAPSHIQDTDWGPGGLEARFADAWDMLVERMSGLVTVVRADDPAEVEAVYQRLLAGEVGPDVGYVLGVDVG